MRFIHLLAPLSLLLACGNKAEEGAQTPESPSVQVAVAAPAPGLSPDTVVASWDGGKITYGDLAGKIQGKLTQMEVEYLTNRYSTEQQALDQMMIEKLLEEEAKARGLADIDALMKIEVEDKVTPPTEAEIQEFYQAMQRQLRGAPLEQVRDRVVQELTRRKQGELAQAYITQLKEKRKSSVTLPFPDLPRINVSADDDPSMGAATAQITIIQFAEYQCPYCGKANEVVEQILKDYEGKVRMVYRDFPLSFHPRAVPAAVAANCAGEQGKYWEMHKLLMSNQRALEETDLTAHAQTLALDLGKWNTCRQKPEVAAEVEKDAADGAEAGVSGTPAFFINGIMLSGALPYDQFKQIIDRELSKG